jgi:transcription elongation factor Elf1
VLYTHLFKGGIMEKSKEFTCVACAALNGKISNIIVKDNEMEAVNAAKNLEKSFGDEENVEIMVVKHYFADEINEIIY